MGGGHHTPIPCESCMKAVYIYRLMRSLCHLSLFFGKLSSTRGLPFEIITLQFANSITDLFTIKTCQTFQTNNSILFSSQTMYQMLEDELDLETRVIETINDIFQE